MMKIAGHTMGTPEYTLDEAVNLFSRLGFDGIEIIWDDQYGCALRKNASGESLKKLKQKIRINIGTFSTPKRETRSEVLYPSILEWLNLYCTNSYTLTAARNVQIQRKRDQQCYYLNNREGK